MAICLKIRKMTNNLRSKRKEDHLRMALSLKMGPKSSGFDDIQLVHQAITGLSMKYVDTSTIFLGKELAAPFLIEAITGGTPSSIEINRKLAMGAAKTNIAMAVGSQTAAIENPQVKDTFSVVREYNPQGVILANVSANVPVATALEAIEMINADGLQLHLNPLQEMVMDEGDRCFNQTALNIKEIIKSSPVPVIIKEVGFGISRETAQQLYELGARYIDVGGAGGTNFAVIENLRREKPLSDQWYSWGIPTASSLLECLDSKLPLTLIASGGIDSGLKAAKALVLGASLAGAATPFLKTIDNEPDSHKLIETIENWIRDLKMAMVLTGASNLAELGTKNAIVTGETKDWAQARNIKL